MNTTENNKLIAEFMEYPSNGFGKYICPVKDIPVEADELPYHTSWDWLMPVVEKIEGCDGVSDEEVVTIEYHDCIIPYHQGEIRAIGADSKIDAVYQAVVAFIKWYNENK